MMTDLCHVLAPSDWFTNTDRLMRKLAVEFSLLQCQDSPKCFPTRGKSSSKESTKWLFTNSFSMFRNFWWKLFPVRKRCFTSWLWKEQKKWPTLWLFLIYFCKSHFHLGMLCFQPKFGGGGVRCPGKGTKDLLICTGTKRCDRNSRCCQGNQIMYHVYQSCATLLLSSSSQHKTKGSPCMFKS